MKSKKKVIKVFFFCYPLGPPDKAGYQHQIISLAEGLKELGIPFFSNVNYWKESDLGTEYLLQHDEGVRYYDCDAVVFSSSIVNYNRTDLLPQDLFNTSRSYKIIYIDDSDGLITAGFDLHNKVDVVLKSHYNKYQKYPENFTPWQFGLSNRLINAVSPKPFAEKEKDVLINFRVSHPMRELASKEVMPILNRYLNPNETLDLISENKAAQDRHLWHQSGRRHYSSFYSRLSNSVACVCFGGGFQENSFDHQGKLMRLLNRIERKMCGSKPNNKFIYQYDSWRFWESLVAGCCTIHADLKKYGVVFPVMPVNGKHYLGVDFENVSRFERVLQERRNLFEDVSQKGREWVLKNYSPKAIAIRFLDLLD